MKRLFRLHYLNDNLAIGNMSKRRGREGARTRKDSLDTEQMIRNDQQAVQHMHISRPQHKVLGNELHKLCFSSYSPEPCTIGTII